ncbi:mitochondrial aspartate-glutamate transporter agc1 [Mycoemilia scoparia]|uniref:Mitochondrial aspartate-glutamate transporter agc1 n=1 Tax=Mycoemilia scoparia TaxID=417184 RepID=A0A9W7ZJ57_9FUNG|nr:mitochondrial aspartate-glutamate transporter agc1 [Mycoemilia scoparia]
MPYKGGVDCFKKIVNREGASGLYRGLVPNLAGITPEKAIKLAVNDFMRERMAKKFGTTTDELPILGGMIAGATAGFCQVIATNPMEIVKIQMQIAGQATSAAPSTATVSSSSSGASAAVATAGAQARGVSTSATAAAVAAQQQQKPLTARQVVQSLGLKGLYRGTCATLLRDVPFSFIFFPGQAFFSKEIDKLTRSPSEIAQSSKPGFSSVFLGSTVAGVIAAAAVTPADVIKTRLQVSPKEGGPPPYKGIADAATHIMKKEGPSAFFKGVVPRCLITAPLFGIAILTYDIQQRLFGF